jgi:hypothetical protein
MSNPSSGKPSPIKVNTPDGSVAGIMTPMRRILMKSKKCEGINSNKQVIAMARFPERPVVPPRYN